ncbi:HAMP domain-containing histidine kinase [Bacillus cereus]|uniref:sensor histidine kinase n=1 Tax=Bacillus TaxID=1386 RepID=UPI0005556A64|nr:HAMP domain-containing sensor histidine kinase [Bacillus sp. UNC322MFChir4.1]
MKPLRRRLIFHFSLQFITLSIGMILLVFALFFLLIQQISSQELRRNFQAGILDCITTDTIIENGEAKIDKKWEKLLRERQMWAQIVNDQGHVITSSNAPSSLPKHYSVGDILEIKETKHFSEFTVLTKVDNTYKKDHIFMVGYKDKQQDILKEFAKTYNLNSQISETNKAELEEQLEKINGTLHIINKQGDIIENIGKPMNLKKYDPLDIVSRETAPGIHSTKMSVYKDPSSDKIWILHTPKKKDKNQTLSIMEEYLIGFGIVGAIVLLITITLSSWNGFRYGRPLFLFTSWLERMEQGSYDEVLTEKERKKIYRKNGKVRMRYRLYKEVINAFYKMAEKLDVSVKERAKLEKTREEWMTGISHDLRTPLSSIQGYGHLLESGHYDWSAEELEEIGKTIREKGDYMLHLIEDFSLTFQLKNNNLLLSKETYQLNDLLETIINKFSDDRTLQDYCFHFKPIHKQVEIEADRKWFERMMDNLIFNAIKHNPSGTTITIGVSESPKGLQICIEDNGVGMDEETMGQLFERYYRGTNTDEQIEGVGLGMSIAKQIATLHGATLEVHSEIGKGTKVYITAYGTSIL